MSVGMCQLLVLYKFSEDLEETAVWNVRTGDICRKHVVKLDWSRLHCDVGQFLHTFDKTHVRRRSISA